MKTNRCIWNTLGSLAAALIVGVATFTPVVGNCWNVITGRGFEIPDESSLLTFTVTEMNHGSGEWWLHAEDHRYFYAYSETPGIRYHAFPKSNVPQCPGFRSTDSATWCKSMTISPVTKR